MHASLMSHVFLNPVKRAIQITHHSSIPCQIDIHTFLSETVTVPSQNTGKAQDKREAENGDWDHGI